MSDDSNDKIRKFITMLGQHFLRDLNRGVDVQVETIFIFEWISKPLRTSGLKF